MYTPSAGQRRKAPSPFTIEFLPASLFSLFIAGGLVVGIFTSSDRYSLLSWLVLVSAFVALLLYYSSRGFLMRLFRLAHQSDDILAYSIAVTLTRDPVSMQKAIQKFEGLNLAEKESRLSSYSSSRCNSEALGYLSFLGYLKHYDPTNSLLLSKYLFVTPTSVSGYFLGSTTLVGPSIAVDELPAPGDTEKARITNLDLIRQGRWRAFEDWYS